MKLCVRESEGSCICVSDLDGLVCAVEEDGVLQTTRLDLSQHTTTTQRRSETGVLCVCVRFLCVPSIYVPRV